MKFGNVRSVQTLLLRSQELSDKLEAHIAEEAAVAAKSAEAAETVTQLRQELNEAHGAIAALASEIAGIKAAMIKKYDEPF